MAKAQRKKASKKELIVQKAACMFREKGFPATSMRDLAESVGIEAASLYNHIQSKSEILEYIISRISDDCNKHLDELDNAGLSGLQKIDSVIRFHIQMMLQKFEDYHVMINEWIHLEPQPLADFISQRRSYVQRLESFVSEGIAAKEIKPILPYIAVLTILSAVRGLEFWHRSQKNYTPEELEENMVTYLIDGLKIN
jgi:TetR/AcrR family transcriptional regulator, cholesterol catabolism regulator